MQTQTALQCTMCGNPTTHYCNQCHSSRYCSRTCQKADWPVHKLLCPSFPNFQTPPTATSKRGILFPADAKAPQFVWVKCEWAVDEDDNIPYQTFDIDEFLGDSAAHRVWAQRNNTRSRTREDLLTVYVCEAGSTNGSLLNHCVVETAQGRYVNFAWPGPLLAVRSQGLTLGDSEMVDVDMVDFRDAVDLLCSYPDVNINFAKPEQTWEVEGVRVNCTGEIKLYGRQVFESVRVPGGHHVFAQSVLASSRLLGFPVKVVGCSPFKDTAGYDHTNSEAVSLFMNSAPGSECIGSVVVVREERGPLAPQHVEALCRYMRPLLNDYKAGTSTKPQFEMLLTKQAFAEFWREYNLLKQVTDRTWTLIPSPV